MFLNFLFPPQDIINKKYGQLIDFDNKQKFKVHDSICYKCKRKTINFETHQSCLKENSLDKVITCFYYNKILKKYILQLKYYHKKGIAKELAKQLYLFLEANETLTQKTIITFVPIHRTKKFFQRGYNQSEILAKDLGKLTNLPVLKLCKKTKNTKSQAKTKSRQERLKNLINSFEQNKFNLDFIPDKIIIVDDIITTGATLEEIIKCIKKTFPSSKLIGLTLARR